jgi:hypothetical protein
MLAHTSGCFFDFSIACFFSHSVYSLFFDRISLTAKSETFSIFIGCCFDSSHMQLDHLAEMKALDCEGGCEGEESWATEQGSEKESPVVSSFHIMDPKLINGS